MNIWALIILEDIDPEFHVSQIKMKYYIAYIHSLQNKAAI